MRVKTHLPVMLLGAALLFAQTPGWSQPLAADGATHDLKAAGHDTKDAAKDTGKDVKKGTKKTYHATKKGTKKVWHKTKSTTKGAVDGGKEGAKH